MSDRKVTLHILYSGLGGHGAVVFPLIEGGFGKESRHFIIFAGDAPPHRGYESICNDLAIDYVYIQKRPHRGFISFQIKILKLVSQLNPRLIFLNGLSAVPAVLLYFLFFPARESLSLLRETQANNLKRAQDWLLLYFAYRYFDLVVHLTPLAAAGARGARFPRLSRARVRVIPNGIDLAHYRPALRDCSFRGPIMLGMLSRLENNKDHLTILRAVSYLRKNHPTIDIRLYIAGEGSTRSTINEHIIELRLTDICVFLGLLEDKDQIRSFLVSLDIYVHSTQGETMSTSIMQAMACGLPIVASDVEGVSNIVHAPHGVLFKYQDERDLVAKLLVLVDDPDLRKRMGLHSRHYAATSFDVRETIRLYEDAVLHLRRF